MKIKLKEIAQIKTGLVLNRKKADIRETTYSYNVVSLKSFNEDAIYNNTFADNFISNEQIKQEYFVQKGDILLRLRKPNFAVYVDEEYEKLIYTSLMVRIKLNDDKRFNPNFLAYYLNSTMVKKALLSEISGTTIPMIKVSNVNEIKIPLINIEKQKKIIKYLKLANKEKELLKNLLIQKKRYSKKIFETLALQGEE